jgi:hypothetical protein
MAKQIKFKRPEHDPVLQQAMRDVRCMPEHEVFVKNLERDFKVEATEIAVLYAGYHKRFRFLSPTQILRMIERGVRQENDWRSWCFDQLTNLNKVMQAWEADNPHSPYPKERGGWGNEQLELQAA